MLRDRTDSRAELWRIAAGQRGYFTAAQARTAGYSYQAQRYHAQHGNWLSIDRALYRFREFSDLPGEGDEQLVRWSLWSKGRAVVSHATALAAHDLGTSNPSRIHLTVPPAFRQKSDAVILHRAELAESDVEDRTGYRVTTPLRALVECAAEGEDQETLDGAVAEALERGVVTRRKLLHAAQLLGPRAELGVERALGAMS
ncbi:type IV toxin-antitoxin system AbiEi family antitoxin domain-containing protein [Streptomyces antibioticus]|uniref:type IV toxin-antitoxin system AbiEi family antitoxin domain-containing protein n=1 Tax=Streptomyces antibioticus TaxID=1890 RepID=UPI0033C007AE